MDENLLIVYFGCVTNISIWPGCEPSIAAAIETFSAQWGPYSTSSRKYSIYRLVRQFIDPAWTQYLDSLVGVDLFAVFELLGYPGSGLVLSQFAHAQGFQALETELIKIHRVLNPLLPGRARAAFTATLDTLRELALGCRLKRPRKTSQRLTPRQHPQGVSDSATRCVVCNDLSAFAQYVLGQDLPDIPVDLALFSSKYCLKHLPGGGRSSFGLPIKRGATVVPISSNLNLGRTHGQPFCELCGRYTELEAHIHGAPWPKGASVEARLSARYCTIHSPRSLEDRRWNLAYRRGNRRRERFDEEFARLERQSYEPSEPMANTGNSVIDVYLMNVVRQLNARPDEESDLRRVASSLVENRVSDKKKEIVMLRASGMMQKDIALRLKMTQQAVSKALRSVPQAYRFE